MQTVFVTAKDDYKLEVIPTGMLEVNTVIISNLKTKDALIIDPGNDLSEIDEYLVMNNLSPILLVGTHAHFDHVGIAYDLKKKYNCPLAIPKDDLFLFNSLKNQAAMFGTDIGTTGNCDFAFEDDCKFECDLKSMKELVSKVKIIHTPGHSPGSTVFYLEHFDTPILFSGDTLFYRSIGRTDLLGGDQEKILNSIEKKIFLLPDNAQVIPGHGPLTLLGDEKVYNPYIRNIRPCRPK